MASKKYLNCTVTILNLKCGKTRKIYISAKMDPMTFQAQVERDLNPNEKIEEISFA